MPPATVATSENGNANGSDVCNGTKHLVPNEENPIVVDNYINGRFVPPSSGKYMPITSPSTSKAIGTVALSSTPDVDNAIASAKRSQKSWANLTIKSRATILMKFHSLVRQHATELARLIVSENGKNMTEALADVAKGNETVEYACSLPQLVQGRTLRVSTDVTCTDRRDALGVVACVVPFNFPFMVPMWTIPIALVLGNAVVLKPSEKVPCTMRRAAELMKEAGVPDGVFNMVQGTAGVVEALIDHNDVRAVTFVGSSPVASIVSSRCRTLNKRVTALGGAKNHLVALPDCDLEGASSDIVVSYAGCAGQRCMAASVLLTVGQGPKQDELLRLVVDKSSKIRPGTGPGQMGPVIDETSYRKIIRYIDDAENKCGAEILLDGRSWSGDKKNNAGDGTDNDIERKEGGCWIGPTVIRHTSPDDACMKEEVFGPVLSIYNVSSWSEAIAIENDNPFGNAACVYTSCGGHAEWFASRFRAAMLGVNIGIPVPREPFSFGGLYGTKSKFGDMDITGDGAIEFFSNRIKITSKWPVPNVDEYVTGEAFVAEASATNKDNETLGSGAPTDHANFAGRM